MYSTRIPTPTISDVAWMRVAIEVAKRGRPDDMPFGCVLVDPVGVVVRHTWGTGSHGDPTSHSEMRAIQETCRESELGPKLLKGYTLYSTHEPCMMCCGAINHAKISRVVWGSFRSDLPQIFRTKTPATQLLSETTHPPYVLVGVLQRECVDLFHEVIKWD